MARAHGAPANVHSPGAPFTPSERRPAYDTNGPRRVAPHTTTSPVLGGPPGPTPLWAGRDAPH